MASTTPWPARSMSCSPVAWPPSIVARSSRRVSSAVSSIMGRRSDSAAAAAGARLAGELLLQPLAIGGVALDAGQEVRVGGDEGEVEQLGFGLLLVVDPLLLVTLERRGALDVVDRLAGQERLVEDVVDVDVEGAVQAGRVLRGGVHLDLRCLHLPLAHASSCGTGSRRALPGAALSRSTIAISSNASSTS